MNKQKRFRNAVIKKTIGINQTTARAIQQLDQFYRMAGENFSLSIIISAALLQFRRSILLEMRAAVAAETPLAEVVEMHVDIAERARSAK
jgi:hypothetical protein